jgi:methylated-DNA-[protein]-cysteine S-methyltransferase
MNAVAEAGVSAPDATAVVAHATLETPIGPIQFFGAEAGLIAVVLPNEGPPAPEARVRRLLGEVEIVENPAALTAALMQFEAYFRGELREFDLPLDPRGTPFQRQVWAAVARIPYGATRAYGEIAAAIGKPAAVRAVGLANGANPLPIVIPCHRVIGANGSLTGYGGGLEAKRRLLALERGQPALLASV